MDENVKPQYAGEKVYMAGREWTVPPLSVRQFREHYKTLIDTTPGEFEEKLKARLPIILAAMQRNYPDLTEEQLLDMLDIETFPKVLEIVSTTSGIRAAKPGE